MSDSENRLENLTFEQAVRRLEALVQMLEDPEASLETALKRYEEGVTLARHCLQQLESAELRVQELSLDAQSGTGGNH